MALDKPYATDMGLLAVRAGSLLDHGLTTPDCASMPTRCRYERCVMLWVARGRDSLFGLRAVLGHTFDLLPPTQLSWSDLRLNLQRHFISTPNALCAMSLSSSSISTCLRRLESACDNVVSDAAILLFGTSNRGILQLAQLYSAVVARATASSDDVPRQSTSNVSYCLKSLP